MEQREHEKVIRINDTRSVFYERWAHIEVQKLQGYKNTFPANDNSVCHHVVCLSASQTILIALLLLFLLLMVVILLIFYSRGKVSSYRDNKRLVTSSYIGTSKNTNIDTLKMENCGQMLYGNSETLPTPKTAKGHPYIDTYMGISPHLLRRQSATGVSDADKLYTNISYDLQSNPYARQRSPKFIPIPHTSQRNSELLKYRGEDIVTSSSTTTEIMDPCYLSIGRPLATVLSHPHSSILSPCSCGSRECEYQPFIASTNVS